MRHQQRRDGRLLLPLRRRLLLADRLDSTERLHPNDGVLEPRDLPGLRGVPGALRFRAIKEGRNTTCTGS